MALINVLQGVMPTHHHPISIKTKETSSPLLQGMGQAQELSLHHESDHKRRSVERYIHTKFKETYHADVDHFLPQILSLSGNGCFSAAVGLRKAESEPLFLEQYLDNAIENEVSSRFGQCVSRDQVIEIGNLVSTYRGGSQLLFLFLTEFLHRVHRRWVVFTATKEVLKILSKLNLTFLTLCEARPEKLLGCSEQWGKYYSARPQVMAGDVSACAAIIRKNRMALDVLREFEADLAKIILEWSGYDAKPNA